MAHLSSEQMSKSWITCHTQGVGKPLEGFPAPRDCSSAQLYIPEQSLGEQSSPSERKSVSKITRGWEQLVVRNYQKPDIVLSVFRADARKCPSLRLFVQRVLCKWLIL